MKPTETDYHEGRPMMRTSRDGKRVMLLCPYGHLLTTIPMREWAGSWLEAYHDKPRKCYGTLPKDRS